jgi:leucyl aminopeptidase
VVGATENAIDGVARRRGDVLHALDSTTIEMVTNWGGTALGFTSTARL